MTASEPLTLEEEYEMQKDWQNDEKSNISYSILLIYTRYLFIKLLNRVHFHCC